MNSRENDVKPFFISIIKRKPQMPNLPKPITNAMHKHMHYEIANVQTKIQNEFYVTPNLKYTITANTFFLTPPHRSHMMELRVNTRLLMSMRQDFARPVFDFLKINIDIFFSLTVL